MARKASVSESPVCVRLPRDLHRAVKERSQVEERTMAQTVRLALRWYLENTAPPP